MAMPDPLLLEFVLLTDPNIFQPPFSELCKKKTVSANSSITCNITLPEFAKSHSVGLHLIKIKIWITLHADQHPHSNIPHKRIVMS